MRRDDLFFGLFVALSTIAPEVPLRVPGESVRATLSLGLPALVAWRATRLCHRRARHAPCPRSASRLWLVFGYYVLAATTLAWALDGSGRLSILYAVQYFLYLFLGHALLPRYIWELHTERRLSALVGVLSILAGVYACGCLVSVVTGPIYPHQAGWVGRLWTGGRLPQGVGFAVTSPAAASVLLTFLPFALVRPGARCRRISVWLALILLVALASTLSRAAFVACVAGLAYFGLLKLVRVLLFRKMSRSTLFVGVVLCVLSLATASLYLLGSDSPIRSEVTSIYFGDQFAESLQFRSHLWSEGLSSWWQASARHVLLGRGFRGSMELSRGSWISQHNTYIAVLGDFGLVGLLLFSAPFVLVLRKASLTTVLTRGIPGHEVALLLLTFQLTMNFSETFLYSPFAATFLLVPFALVDTMSAARSGVGTGIDASMGIPPLSAHATLGPVCSGLGTDAPSGSAARADLFVGR